MHEVARRKEKGGETYSYGVAGRGGVECRGTGISATAPAERNRRDVALLDLDGREAVFP